MLLDTLSSLLSRHVPPPVSPPPAPYAPTDLIAVSANFAVIDLLRKAAWLNLNLVLFGRISLPFTQADLLEIYGLLPENEEPVNLVMSPRQSMLLYRYTQYHHRMALDEEEYGLAHLYAQFMDEVLPGTLISFQR